MSNGEDTVDCLRNTVYNRRWMDPLLLLEVPFDVGFDAESEELHFLSYDARGRIVGVTHRLDRATDGRVEREYGVLLVKDRGFAAARPSVARKAVVVRYRGHVTPLPDSCGDLVGRFATEHGRWEWLVFVHRQDPQALSGKSPAKAAPARTERTESEAPPPVRRSVGIAGSSASRPTTPEPQEDVWPFPA